MTVSLREINVKQKSENVKNKTSKKVVLFFAMLSFFVLLFFRDAYSISINKNVFIMITAVCAVIMNLSDLICLFCFLFPLYVGLPGNYMTLILLLRMLFEFNKFKVKISSFVLSVLVSVFMLCQNILTGYTGIVPMMFIGAIAVCLLLFSYKERIDSVTMTLAYSFGVASLGLIMLISTLNNFDLSDLLTTSTRLGSGSVNYAEEGVMNVSVDPNFYGIFSISAISTAIPLIVKLNPKMIIKITLSLTSTISLIIAFIGLSRAYIIVFVIWILAYTLSQKNTKGFFISLLVLSATFFIVGVVIPEVLDSLLSRFGEADMATGNGRTGLMSKFYNLWLESFSTAVFGVGLYYCNVHCMPLQFLFGGGVLLFALMLALSITFIDRNKDCASAIGKLPVFSTFAMMCTTPAAGLFNCMFPLVLCGLLVKNSSIAVEG